MDVAPLKIDREAPSRRRRRGGLASAVKWVLLLLVVGGAAWLFRVPLMRRLDRLTLPAVGVVEAARTSPLAASAVSGTAANGYVVASKRAALSADTPGRVVEMNVEEGSVVKKGQVVARLYSLEYEAALRQTEAELGAASQSVARARVEEQAARTDLTALTADVTAAEARVKEAEATLEIAEINFGRAKSLVESGIHAQQAADDARTTRDAAQASLASFEAMLAAARAAVDQGGARVQVAEATTHELEALIPVRTAARDLAAATLDKTEVRAPFDGIVILKDAEVGEVVSPNSVGSQSRGSVVTMVDFDSLEVQVEMPETTIAAVEIGGDANVYLDAFPRKLYKGRVQRIWPTANRQKATIEVRVAFLEPDELLRPEMGARVVFSPKEFGDAPAGDAIDVVLIPKPSVVRVDGRPGVFVLERDVARWRGLELGDERGGRVVVAAGLEGGERLVADPPVDLEDGDRVQVRE